jgi:SAM-dependent methyltransferase
LAAFKALAAQLLAWLLVAAGCIALGRPLAPSLPLAALQGALAAGIGVLLKSERWWMAIHLAFSPALVAALRLDLPPAVPLAVLAGLTFVFWTTFRGEVPLFLSSRAVADALLDLLPPHPGLRVIDLGAGTGGLLRQLAQARGDAHFTGIEHAPFPWLAARLNARGLANLAIRRADLWRQPLDGQDVVYVFLSPRVMPRLWQKARADMRPGSLLVSSSFPVPDVAPERVVEVADRRGTRLYCYRM